MGHAINYAVYERNVSRKRFTHRMVRVVVKGNEIHLVSNTVDRFVGTIE